MADTSSGASILVRGAREHNLRNVDLELPRDQLIVFTGLSGSGKSSLAFDTIYAEGQRRYVESLSAYARQFLGQMDKPDVDFIEGLSPAISIDQKSASRNPRSTVGTITEIYDYLRLLYARIGVPHCPNCGRLITRQTPQQIVDRVLQLPDGTRFQVLAPVVRGRKGEYDALLDELAAQGFTRARVDGEVARPRRQARRSTRYEQHTIEVVVDRLVRRAGIERRLTDSLETALQLAEGVAEVEIVPQGRQTRPSPRRSRSREHLACTHCGLVVRGARAPQLLVQLAVRRVRDVRRARHDASRSTPSSSSPTTTSRSTTARSRRGRGSAAEYFNRVLDGGRRRVRLRRRHAVEEAEGRRTRRSCSTARARKQVHRPLQEPVRAPALVHDAVRGRRPVGRAPPHRERSRDRVREQIEGYMREVPCPACGGARLRPASLAVTVGGTQHLRGRRAVDRATASRSSRRSSCPSATG